MKPLLNNRVVRHVLFWGLVLSVDLFIQLPGYWVHHAPLYGWPLLFVLLPGCLVCVYPLVYWLLPRLMQHRQLSKSLTWLGAWMLASLLLVNTLSSFYHYAIAPALFDDVPKMPFVWTDIIWRVRASFLVLLAVAGVLVVRKVMAEWQRQQRRHQQLQQRRLQTELELLKAQLQPAFLFDTLATLQRLAAAKAPESPAAVLHLSALLRYLLYESQLAAVPLPAEAELLQHYVALEQLRLGHGVEVSFSTSGPLDAHQIAPLLLLPFLENAFRLVAAAPPDCRWVSIDLAAKTHALTVKIISGRGSDAAGPEEEPALHAIRERLTRLYPGQHELKTVAEPDTFLVVLRLRPATAAPPAALPEFELTSHA